jgi:Skp family chaperone for outer membrane proteins
MSKLETDFTKAQSELEALQKEAQSKSSVLNDSAKAELAGKIDRKNTELTRINEDAQKQMSDLQERHFGPIAQAISKEVSSYASEQGLALVLDGSMQPSNIIFASDIADITTEIIRRYNANAGKTSSAPAATPKTATPTAPASTRPAPGVTAPPKPPTPTAPK